ncbi:unnamed protein product [Merluccius merluccius]
MGNMTCMVLFLLNLSLVVTPDTSQFLKYDRFTLLCEEDEGEEEQQLEGWKVMVNTSDGEVLCVSSEVYPASYSVAVAFPSDSALYWCQSALGETSNHIRITVTDGNVILESPVLPVMEGRHVTLGCRTRTPTLPVSADFYKDGSLIRTEPTPRMTIHNVSKADEGLYKCSVSGLLGYSPESWLAVTGEDSCFSVCLPASLPPSPCHFLFTPRMLCYAIFRLPFLVSTILLLLVYKDRAAALPTSSQDAGSKLVVVPGNNRTVISEKLEIVRKWGITTYMCTRQTLSERLGTGSRTVDLDLEPQLEDLSENQQRYSHLTKLADTLANQVAQFATTQKSLGDAFADLSIKSPTLHVEFGVNADAQHFLSKRGEELAVAVGSFSSDVNTLVSRTIEDTMVNVKQYHSHRVEYDAYRCDLEELNLGPRDVSTRTKLEQAERNLQIQRKRYLQSRDDLSVKLRLLEENKVKVLQRQLLLLQAAGASHNLSCHQHLQAKLQERSIQLDSCPALDSLSWLESSC